MAADLAILIKARDEASRVLDKVGGKTEGLGKKLAGAVRAGALAGGVAIAGLGVAAIKMGADFEKGISEVRTLLPQLSEQGFNQLRGQVLDLSKELGISTNELVPALYQAISAGVPAENVIDFMRTGAKASIGGVTDLTTAVDGLTTVVNAFGLGADETGRVADVMFTAVKLGKTTMGELSASMSTVAPLAAALGLDISDVAAATATLTKSGAPTAEAMIQIRSALVALQRTTPQMDEALQSLGFASGDAALEALGFQGTMEALAAEAGRTGTPLIDLFGRVEGLQAALGLTGEQAAVAQADLAAMKDSTGAADEAFETMDATLSRKFAKAMNLLKVSLTEVGVKLLPVVASALQKALPFLERNLPVAIAKIEGVVRAVRPTVEQFLRAFVSGLSTLHAAFEPVVKFILSNKPALIAAIAAIGLAILLAFGPGAIAIVALIGFIALLGLIRDNVGEWKDAVVGFFTDLKGDVEGIINGFVSFLEDNWQTIVQVALAVLFPPGAGLFFIITHFGEIKDKVMGVVTAFKDLLADNWKTIVTVALAILFPPGAGLFALVTNAGGVRDKVVAAFAAIPGLLRGLAVSFGNAASELGLKLVQGIVQSISSIPGVAGDIASAVGRAIKDVINTQIIDKLNRALEFEIDLGIKKVRINPPDIPHLAHGGFVPPGVVTPAILHGGRRGEAVIPLDRAAGAGQQVTIIVNSKFPPDRSMLRQEARDILNELSRMQKLGLA